MNVEYKGYSIQNDGTYGYKEIKPLGKGSVHKVLRGSYTDVKSAKIAIDSYESAKPAPKGKGTVKDGESK